MNVRKDIFKALIAAKQGNWTIAHNIAQSNEGHPDYDRLHDLLHRIEGDIYNAKYWYNICNITIPEIETAVELEQLLLKYSI
jgi:hypothetical protein